MHVDILTDRPQARLRAMVLVALGVMALVAAVAVSVMGPGQDKRSGAYRAFATGVPTASALADAVNEVTPSALLPVAPNDAKAINAAMPLAMGNNPPASSIAPYGSSTAYSQALDCMTAAIYYEAASESDDGERAVAQVVLNRMRHPAFPHSVCGVVFQGSERSTGCQFSFTCDGSLGRTPSRDGWARARRIATSALTGGVFAPVGWSTHYHADYVVPRWAGELRKVAVVGAHIFYRWPSGLGMPKAFSARYAGAESTGSWLIAAALARSGPAEPMPEAVADAAGMGIRASIRDGEMAQPVSRGTAPPRWAIRPGATASAEPQAAAPVPGAARPVIRPLMSITNDLPK